MGSVIATSAIVLPSLVIMLLLCKLYFVLNARFQRSIYFQQTMRMLRFSVLGLIAAAALCLMTPVSFIDWRSWVIFVVVSVLTIAPQYIQMTDSNGKNAIYLLRKSVQIISHPIILIVLAGLVGYFIYA